MNVCSEQTERALLRFWSPCFHRTGNVSVILHLREGSPVSGVEVVERLVNLPLRHVLETPTSSVGQQLLGVLQLDAAHALLDPPQASSCRQE